LANSLALSALLDAQVPWDVRNLTEMSFRNFPGRKPLSAHNADSFTAFFEPIV
jgi:hypothetical protein